MRTPAARLPAAAAASALLILPGEAQEVVHTLDPGPGLGIILPAGDIDRDGVADLIWGTHFALGVDTLVSSGAAGLLLHAIDGPGYHGSGIGAGGDIDADGHDDFLVADPVSLLPTPRAYSGADGSLLHAFPSETSGGSQGAGLAIVPDVDGDGHDEILIGAPHEPVPGGFGVVHLRSGADGTELLAIPAQPPQDAFGGELASAGDVDGDGVADLVIGVGRFGPIRVVSLVSGEDLLSIPNPSAQDRFGSQVGTVGDADGDGRSDVFVGGPEASPASSPQPGRVSVFRGAGGAELWTVHGEAVGDLFGMAVEAVGDLDGDGALEIAVGAPGQHAGDAAGSGSIRVFSGATGVELLSITGAQLGDSVGAYLASAGDVNGDGLPELAVPGASGIIILSLGDLALQSDVPAVTVGGGGAQVLTLDAGPALAGHLYLVLGSASGIAPGFTLAGIHVPLNFDAYLPITVTSANLPPFQSTFGELDGAGSASASFALAPGTPASLAGLVLHHAFLVLDPSTSALGLTSNAVSLLLVP